MTRGGVRGDTRVERVLFFFAIVSVDGNRVVNSYISKRWQ